MLFIQTSFTNYCHVNSVILCFGFKLDLCDILYAFLFDVRNLKILGYLISVRYLKRVLLDWLFIPSLGMCFSIVREVVTVH